MKDDHPTEPMHERDADISEHLKIAAALVIANRIKFEALTQEIRCLMEKIHELENPWIDADKEKPEKWQRVIVLENGFAGTGSWTGEKWESTISSVTHWMPMPKAPKEGM